MFKKVLKKDWFYTDEMANTEFYLTDNSFHDISVAAYDTVNGTFREFLVDFVTLKSIYQFSKEEELKVTKRFVDNTYKLPLIKAYVEKDKMTLIKKQAGSMYGAAVLGKIMEYHPSEDETFKALLLKRVAYLPMASNSILGIDTLALPLGAAVALIESLKKKFKEVDIEIDLESGGEE